MNYQIIPVTSYQQNCTLLICEATRKAAFVDPGGDIDVLKAALDKHHVDLEKIFLTHGHLDHVGATAELSKLYSVPVEGPHEGDQFWIDAIPSQCEIFGFPPCEVFEPDVWLKHGDQVEFGEQKLDVMHCPGHTPGHVIFYHRNSHLAMVGDVLFKGSIGRTDFPRGNYQMLIDSIKKRLWPLGDETEFIPGHGPMSTFGEERRSNPFVHD